MKHMLRAAGAVTLVSEVRELSQADGASETVAFSDHNRAPRALGLWAR